MPIYEYRCEQGHTFEVMQRISDDPVATCQTCDAPVRRVFHPVAVHFKGSGFYNTDYGTRKRQHERDTAESNGKASDSSSSDSKSEKSEKSDASKADSSKSDSSKAGSAKAESKAASKSGD